MRTASLLHYLAERRPVHLVRFSEQPESEPGRDLPADLVDAVDLVLLPRHGRSAITRASRNARRLAMGRPPLLDRFGQPETLRQVERVTQSKRYSVAIAEHFWCAGYLPLLRRRAERVVLDLHNVESALHAACARTEPWPQRLAHRIFQRHAERWERRLFPLFDLILTTSQQDAERVLRISPTARVAVYPNALPLRPAPVSQGSNQREVIAFSGNLEYHPNITAVRFFRTRIWPELSRLRPGLVWKLIGKNEHAVRSLVQGDARIELTGPVDDALRELSGADVAIAPLLAGSGTRVKIMEAWAARRAVVSTPIGAEGLPAEDGVNIVLARSATDWVGTVVRLLDDPASRARLGAAGRETFERELCWPAAWERLDRSLGILQHAAWSRGGLVTAE